MSFIGCKACGNLRFPNVFAKDNRIHSTKSFIVKVPFARAEISHVERLHEIVDTLTQRSKRTFIFCTCPYVAWHSDIR